MTDWPKCIQNWDQDISQGRGRAVTTALKSLNYAKIPRQYVAAIAKIAYRAGLPFVSLRIINRLIRPGKNRWLKTTPEEVAEYAMALIRIGASPEALKTLEPLSGADQPTVLLYRSFALITRWEYREAAPFLEEYIHHKNVTDYQRLVGQVNLAAAWVNIEKFDAAEKSLAQLVRVTQERSLSLLYGNCLELLAQIAVFKQDWPRAEELLRKGHAQLAESSSVDFLFLQKWQCLLKLYRQPKSQTALKERAAVRNQAIEREHWETVRDCDFYAAKFSADENLLRYVYYGTPFNGYRQFMQRRLEKGFTPSEAYVYSAATLQNPKKIFDLKEASDARQTMMLKKGQLLHRLLNHLCSDFYRPFRLGAIFNELYPKEYFDAELSVIKINQLAERLRGWFCENQVGAELTGKSGAYKLRVSAETGFRIHDGNTIKSGLALYHQRLQEHFNEREFTAAKAAEALNVTKRMVNKIIAWDEGKTISKKGRGPTISYYFESEDG